MIGRATDKFKRFDLGIKSMKYIIKEVPECEMKIISNLDNISEFKEIVKKLDLENKVKFIGYTSKPEIYFVNASLHIFPTISESFGLVLSETKIFGIPNILTGLDFVTLSEGGTVIIYDDNPETIGKEAIKILIDNNYRKKLGNEARESMKKFNNKLTIKKWIKLINSVYKGDEYYINLTKNEHIILDKDAINILKNQTKLLQKREPFFKNITTQLLLNYTYLSKLLS
jgi:glycosyltransferase involved in cell wall biosynthesis